MKKTRIALYLLTLIIALSVACKQSETKLQPVELTREHMCQVCGMIIVDFPGAKAQIHYKKGKYDTFCSTLDMFLFYLQPDRPKDITAIYVNDMGKADMEHPVNLWTDATKAFYVYGGDVMGPMGEAMIPFSELKDAAAYIKQHGGKLIAFNDVTMDMLRPH
ncbi:MAG: nitrous oxide reductase accessory protein NosL [Nitrospirae bacterium]|nr:nitrous oxide reductase accessory protein NosL [Nitrospirota bacterium]